MSEAKPKALDFHTVAASVVGSIDDELNAAIGELQLHLESIGSATLSLEKLAAELDAVDEETVDSPFDTHELHRLRRDALGAIASVVSNLQTFVADARLATGIGGVTLPIRATSVENVVDATVRLMWRELVGVRVQRDYGANTPPLMLPMPMIAQAIAALISNSVRAMRLLPGNSHSLRITTESDSSTVGVSISDTGVSIHQESIGKVFDRAHVVERPRAGLFVAKQIAESLGGELLVESFHGTGANLALVLPIHPISPSDRPQMR